MKFLALAAFLAISAVSSFATTVTYSTTGTICPVGNPACGANSQDLGALIVKFNNIASSTVDALPTTFGSLGEVDFDCKLPGQETTACADASVSGFVLTITISQTTPVNGSNAIVGSFAGSISGTASNAIVTWGTQSVLIGPIRYSAFDNSLVVPAPSIALAQPSVNNGVTSIQAAITDTTIPEPSTYAMIGGALVALAAIRRRK